MDQVLVRRIEEKRQSRDKVAAKLDAIRKQIETYTEAQSKHLVDLEAKDRVLGMLETLGQEYETLSAQAATIQPLLKDLIQQHRTAGTPHRKDPSFMKLFEEHERTAKRLMEIPLLANRVFFGKVKDIS